MIWRGKLNSWAGVRVARKIIQYVMSDWLK